MLTDTQLRGPGLEVRPQDLSSRAAQAAWAGGDEWRSQTRRLTRFQRGYEPLKWLAEMLAAVVLSVLAIPIVAVAAVLIKATSRGPAFYTQTRLGRGGLPFTIYKLRTMIHNCESLTGPRWAIPGDPRITRVGQVLRLTHLDELPQLINVLRGEMSLIGPRPERPEFVRDLERALPGYRDRLLVRPGVTGLAQVQLEADTGLESVRRKLAYDMFYIQHPGPWLDVRILGCTALRVFGVSFRSLQKLFQIPSREMIEATLKVGPAENQTPHRLKAA